MRYYPFGETRYTWGSTPTDRRYTGQRQESVALGSLYDYGARFYAPALGRWLSPDTLVPDPANPQSLNRYTYVRNRPLNYIDPSGHKECEKSTDAGTCQGATSEERRRAQACADIPGWCTPNAQGAAPLLETLGSILFEPLDWILTARDCFGGDCSGVLLAALPFVPGTARKVFNAVDGGADLARAVDNASDAAETVGDLRKAGRKDAHHIIQDAAVRDLLGYNTNAAPGVQLQGPSTVPGTQHYVATQVQRQAGGGTYGAERRIGYKALRRAGYSPQEARALINSADDYFQSLGVTSDTPTRIPANRRR